MCKAKQTNYKILAIMFGSMNDQWRRKVTELKLFIHISKRQNWYRILSFTHRYFRNGSKFLIHVFYNCENQNRNWYPIKVLYRNIDLSATNRVYPIPYYTPIPGPEKNT